MHSNRLTPLLIVVLAAFGLSCTAGVASANQTIATTARPTAIATGQGIVAYSAYDPAVHGYRLMIDRLGKTVRADVAPSATPFDVDVGPTPAGHDYLVYSRCRTRATPVPRGCDIYAYDVINHRELRIDGADSGRSEVHPTYWDGRLAFVRYYGSGDDPHPVVYTRRTRSSRPSQRLPGLPDRRCIKHAGCGPVTGTIDELELYGDHLAQAASTVSHVRYRRRLTELRLVDVDSGRSQQIAARGTGESGQEFIGPSFRAGRLYAYFTCHGDGGGCAHGIGGAYRYRYSTGQWSKAPDTTQLAAFGVSYIGTVELPTNVRGGCGPIDVPLSTCHIRVVRPAPDYSEMSRPPRTE
jgi:hypothetical protein